MVDAFFRKEADAIEALEAQLSEKEGALNEAVEAVEYEPEEEESVTAGKDSGGVGGGGITRSC